MPHIAVKVNMLIDIDVELVSEYKWAKVMSCKFVTLVSTTQNSTTSLLYTGSSTSMLL